MARIDGILDRLQFTNNGPLVQEFEQRIADYANVAHCVATCNATVALQLASHALGLSGEVIVPSYTFVATAHALTWQGLTPVFADIDPDTHSLDPGSLDERVTARTSAILGVHLWGRPCDVDALEEVAARHGLPLFFDAAHALGCSHNGRMIGSFGRCEVFSFHATKFVNSFEGGAVVTDDAALAEKLRLLRNFGFCGMDNVVGLGINGKMSEISAAMGLTSLESVDELVAINRANHDAYRVQLADVPGVRVFEYDPRERNNYQYVVVELTAPDEIRLRDRLVDALSAAGIIARRYFWPGCHRMEPYRQDSQVQSGRLPNTEAVADRVIVLPTGQSVDRETVAEICDLIRRFLLRARS